MATRALRLRTDSKDRERTYHHDPLLAQVSEKGADRLSRSDHTWPHASAGQRGDIPHGRGDRALLRYNTQRIDPVTKRLCDIRVCLLDGFAYIRTHSAEPPRCELRDARVRRTRQVRQAPCRLPHRACESRHPGLSGGSQRPLRSTIHPTQLQWDRYRLFPALWWLHQTLSIPYYQHGQIILTQGWYTQKHARPHTSSLFCNNTIDKWCWYPYNTRTSRPCIHHNDASLYPCDQSQAQGGSSKIS